MTTKIAIQEHMRDRLSAWASERRFRHDWVAYEESRMHSLVNQFRVQRGLPPIDIAAVAQANQCAAGHADYAFKFTLYCAEMAVGEEVRWPS